jgi:hypothetical protein
MWISQLIASGLRLSGKSSTAPHRAAVTIDYYGSTEWQEKGKKSIHVSTVNAH